MRVTFCGEYQSVRLRQLAEGDIEALRLWRGDAANSRYITPLGAITPQMQREWFHRVLQDEDCYTFAVDETAELQRLVGSVSLYNFCGKTAEFGRFMIGEPAAHGKGIGRKSTVLALHLGFTVLGLGKIHAMVHIDNAPALTVYRQAGFSIEGRHVSELGMPEYRIVVEKNRFYCQNAGLDAIITNGKDIF